MKTLLLLRHAKSSWDDASLADFERPLAPRGRRDAPLVGRALAASGHMPDVVISSPAKRARETVAAVLEAAGLLVAPSFDESVYAASSAELIKVVRNIPDAASCAMMVGHNPGFEDLAERLAGSPERMPTAALTCIQFEVDRWADVEDRAGKTLWRLTPKKIRAGKSG